MKKPPPPSQTPRPPRPILLLATVFFTNFLSLACQVIWLRKISFLFGSTAAVLSTVLSVFLLGLAGGALMAGRLADRSERPWRLLGLVEIALGAYCVLSLPIFEWGRSVFLSVFPSDMEPLPSALAKLVVVLFAMIVPTAAIGAVFPLAVRLYGRDLGHVGHDLSLVYGLDTLGAAVGALAAGFLLVPNLGLTTSTWALGLTAAGLGVLILLLRGEKAAANRRERKARRAVEPDSVGSPGDSPAVRPVVLLTVFFFTGAAALLLETGWNRFFSLLNGTHIYSTSTVLAGFLAGVGLGSLLMAKRIDTLRDPFGTVACLFAAVALSGVMVFRSGDLFTRAYFSIFEWSGGYYSFQLAVCLVIGLLVLVATLALGANFPLVARLVTRAAEERGTAAGKVFFVNTLGAVAGAFAAEFLVLPAWGFTGLILITLAIYLVGTAVFLAVSPERRLAPIAVSGVLLLAAVVFSPAVLEVQMPFHALYYHGLRAGSLASYQQEIRALRPVSERQGFYGQVAVVALGEDLLLKHNGKTDASTAVQDNRTQLLLGHLPMLFHPDPKKVLAIGLGGGFTLRAVTHQSQAQSITAVEIDPLVVETARRELGPFNDHALDDPRVRVVYNDGRNFIDATNETFDVITSEPPNIWVAGVSGLFTQELYRSAAKRLNPRGILCQWVPLYEMEREDFRIMLHTLTSVFPEVTFWQAGSDVLLLASKEPFQIEFDQVLAKLSEPKVRRDFEDIGLSVQATMDFLNQPAVQPQQVPTFLGEIETLNVDDKPVLEFSTARNLYELAKPSGR